MAKSGKIGQYIGLEDSDMDEQIIKGFDNVGRHEVTQAELPLSCPMPGMILWNAHPRVYLPIEATGEAICPYCSAEYFLKDFIRDTVS